MSIKVVRTLDVLHPILISSIKKVREDVIVKHSMPFALFETGRSTERHQALLNKGRTRSPICKHSYNLTNDPPLYATAVDFVYFNGKWSWNIRDSSVKAWYILFGNIVLDACPELRWGGMDRKNTNYTHFELRDEVVLDNLDKYPCVVR